MTIHLSDNWHYNVNENYATHGPAYAAWVDVFLAAGWTAVQSSDGSAVTASVVPTSTQWGNANAWVHLRDPGGASGRDLAFQRGANPHTLLMYLGKAGEPMTGGDATTLPSSAGRLQIVGTGGSGQTNFFGTATTTQYRMHFAAKATPGGTSGDVYSFWFMCMSTNSVATPQGFLFVDSVMSTADGTTGDPDNEPWVSTTSSNGLGNLRGWYKADLTGEAQTTTLSANEPTGWTGRNPLTLFDDLPPLLIGETTGGREQRKGFLENICGDSPIRGQFAVLSPATEGECRLNVGVWAIPWPHNVSYGF